ncbi:EF-hand domain-containing protein [Stenotrophomonas tumulicola]|uniref:EF-hand domain-containing protein n=1 Tax=Stenotrophomonas tumulicola TaxID=1685415 RepID=A0A7W3IJ92_9GAMM|nr:EF-hand domain-containing protein [Stenotrophomonas tumulicola]MBA8683091.1 EF-hand domain-containing protein [Stenotrophomonas tumulicola]
MTLRNRKPLIALLVAAGSVFALPAMAQSAAPTQQQPPTTGAPTQQAQPAAQSGGDGQTWASVDTDGNGTISKSEAAVNAGLSQVFEQADTNADGELTPDEYKAFVEKAQQGAAGAAPPQGN